jgi:ankyrin repeat protein
LGDRFNPNSHLIATGVAMSEGHIKVFQLLLEKGLKGDLNNSSLLINAADCSDYEKALEMTNILFDRGASVSANQASRAHGGDALKCAAARGYIQIAQILLEREADVNYHQGEPLMQAAKSTPAMVSSLVDKGANVQEYGATAIGGALQNPSLENGLAIIDMLLARGTDINKEVHHSNNRPLIVLAAEKGEPRLVAKLIEARIDLKKLARIETPHQGKVEGEVGLEALFVAMKNRHEGVAKLLLDTGVNVKPLSIELFRTAVQLNLESTMAGLLEHGIEVNQDSFRIMYGLFSPTNNPPFKIWSPLDDLYITWTFLDAYNKGNKKLMSLKFTADLDKHVFGEVQKLPNDSNRLCYPNKKGVALKNIFNSPYVIAYLKASSIAEQGKNVEVLRELSGEASLFERLDYAEEPLAAESAAVAASEVGVQGYEEANETEVPDINPAVLAAASSDI